MTRTEQPQRGRAPAARNTAASLRNDRRGAAAMFFALALLPVLVGLGGAIDYARARSQRTSLSQALDMAVLAAARNGQTSTAYLENFIVANLHGAGSVSSPSLTASTAGDGSTLYAADARLNVPTSFLKLVGINSVSVGAHAEVTVPAQIVNVVVTAVAATGAYSKDIFVWTKDSTGAVTSRQTVLTYRYNSSTGSKVITPPIGSPSLNFSVPLYASFGLGMVVYEDWTHYSGALINPVTKWSDAANAATFIKQTGACLDAAGATFNWEDGGDSNFKDFIYTMKCTTGIPSGASVRLSK